MNWEKIDRNLRSAFKKIKQELDDHLDTINMNTNEIQSNYEEILDLKQRVDKLTEMVDELRFLLNPRLRIKDTKLSSVEEKVFIVLYTFGKLSLSDISSKTGLSFQEIENALYSMIVKGFPIYREIEKDKILFYMDPYFKDLQARRRIVNLDLHY